MSHFSSSPYFFSYLYHSPILFFFFFFNDTATTEIYTLSLHDALPISQALQLGVERVPFEVEIVEVKAGEVVEVGGGAGRDGYAIHAFATEHGGGSVGYSLREHERPGRFDPDKARAAGVPEGHLWGKLQRGETVELADGRKVSAEGIGGPQRPGR